MSQRLKDFMKQWNIFLVDVLQYKRFDKNYLVSLPMKKRIFYILYFSRMEWLIRMLAR
ncbi:hypothetical protein BPO_1899 [Bergeyella porcorum]|uniref:Uncharacterized protein n=1 Tax=Bergeyella porcorum TaxID=1735111 RepID=A0AAU0F365_9FLAO